MIITLDTGKKTLSTNDNGVSRELDLYSKEAFALLSEQILRVGWNQKYPYTFSWMGRPIIQIPDDIVRMQEAIYQVKPDVIIETGIAHGGSLIFYASLFKAMGRGKVIGIDVEIRPQNRAALEAHELSSYLTLIEGSSIDPVVVEKVKALVEPGQRIMVVLDSCHTKAHVLGELMAYHSLVSMGSYIVATDGYMKDLHDVPRGNPEWRDDNPTAAALEFAAAHADFIVSSPILNFNESGLGDHLTYWPSAWLKRIS
jgi:cephalosporin hydroxylase